MKNIDLNKDWIEFLEYIPYERLFQLYSESLFVVLPLKNWGALYPSGIRGLLEAKMFEKAVMASFSPVLKEYLSEDDGVLYVEPENVNGLRSKIISILEDPHARRELEKKGADVIRKNYNMDVFADAFGKYLSNLFES